jgi:hypothetical protein
MHRSFFLFNTVRFGDRTVSVFMGYLLTWAQSTELHPRQGLSLTFIDLQELQLEINEYSCVSDDSTEAE